MKLIRGQITRKILEKYRLSRFGVSNEKTPDRGYYCVNVKSSNTNATSESLLFTRLKQTQYEMRDGLWPPYILVYKNNGYLVNISLTKSRENDLFYYYKATLLERNKDAPDLIKELISNCYYCYKGVRISFEQL